MPSNNSPMIFENLFSSNIQRIKKKKKESNQIKSTAIICVSEPAPPTRNLKHRPCNKMSNPTMMVSFLSPASQFTNKYQVSNSSTCRSPIPGMCFATRTPSLNRFSCILNIRAKLPNNLIHQNRDNAFLCQFFYNQGNP